MGRKYYPSVEDIIKVMKHPTIKRSWIFTEYGYWTIEYNGRPPTTTRYNETYLKYKLLNEYPRVVNGDGIIDNINDGLYYDTHGGKYYDYDLIWGYIEELENNIPDLDIWWQEF